GIALFDDAFAEYGFEICIRSIERAAQGKTHAATLRINADDAQDQLLALVHNLLRMLNALISQLGNVNESLDAIFNASERTEVGELGHGTAYQLTDLVAVLYAAPGLSLGALDGESDLLLGCVDT